MSTRVTNCQRSTITRYQVPDWRNRNVQLYSDAHSTRQQSFDLRSEASSLEIDTDNKTKWDQFNTNSKLCERAFEVERWRSELQKTHDELLQEMDVLRGGKEFCERALESKLEVESAITECLALRETRREFEVVRDPVEKSLFSEQNMIAKIRQRLKEVCEKSWEMLNSLENVRQKIEFDVENKNKALDIDIDQLSLSEKSACLGYRHQANKIPKKSVEPKTWHDFSKNNHAEAIDAMIKSQKIRECIFHIVEDTFNDLKVTVDSTDFEFRKRLYEIKRAKEETEYQIKMTKGEMERQEKTVNDLERAIEAKSHPMKLAQTRLDNRSNRPHVELCCDEPLSGLLNEVERLQESITQLEEKLKKAKKVLSNLNIRLHEMEEDLERKSQAYSVDQRCMDVRKKIIELDLFAIKSQTDRNLRLTGALRDKTRFLENSTVVS